VSGAPAKAPKPVKAPKPARAPKASNAPEAAGAVAAPAPDQSAALPPGQAKKRAEAPKKP
jgi:hypothetical protein